MNKELKKIIREECKKLSLPIKFHRYKRGECSCCYYPENTDIFINTNTPGNWFGDYYKIVYDNDLYEDKIVELVKILRPFIKTKGYKVSEYFEKGRAVLINKI